MTRSRWESGMPLEMPLGSRDRYSPVRGHDEMPAGVSDPMAVAATIVGDHRRGQLICRMAPRLVKAEIITLSGAPVPEGEMAERARLFDRIRTGGRREAADAAAELWETRRAWLVPATRNGKGVVDPKESKPRDEAPGVAFEGAGELTMSEEG